MQGRVVVGERAGARRPGANLLVHLCEPAKRARMLGIDLEHELADRDRLDEEAILRVALGGPLVRLDRHLGVGESLVGLGGALGPLRVAWLDPLQLEIRSERAFVLTCGGRCRGFFAQCSAVFGHPR